jgi:hypothetical protein
MRALALAPLAAALLSGVACKTVQPMPAQNIAAAQPDVVFVTYKDNSQVAVEKPHISGDSLYGTWQGLQEQLAVPLSAVERIESFQPDGKRTVTAVVGIGAASIAMTYLILKFAGSGTNCDYTRGNTDQQMGATAVGSCPDGNVAPM